MEQEQKWNRCACFLYVFPQIENEPRVKNYLPELFPMSEPAPHIYISQSIYIIILVWWERCMHEI